MDPAQTLATPYFSTVSDVPDPPVFSPGHDDQDDNKDRPKAGGGHDDPGHPPATGASARETRETASKSKIYTCMK